MQSGDHVYFKGFSIVAPDKARYLKDRYPVLD